MPKRDIRSGGFVGLILLAVVIVLAVRACRSTACAGEAGSDSASHAA